MTIGPVHLVVIGLPNDKLKGEIERELHRASEKGVIRVLDALAVQKTDMGDVVSLGASDLTPEQREEYGAVIGGLMGFGATGTAEGIEVGAEMGALAFANRNFGLSSEDIQNIADDIPRGTTAVMVLFEHRWAVRLKESVENAGGIVLAQGIVRPENLVAFGANLAAASTIAEQREATTEERLH